MTTEVGPDTGSLKSSALTNSGIVDGRNVKIKGQKISGGMQVQRPFVSI